MRIHVDSSPYGNQLSNATPGSVRGKVTEEEAGVWWYVENCRHRVQVFMKNEAVVRSRFGSLAWVKEH